MKTLTTTDTAEVLAAMFTENTGAHFLDSGSAYGRHHERHAGKTARDFLNAPRLVNEGDYFSLDAFHWLNDRLEYEPALDAALQAYYDASDDYALAIMEQLPISLGVDPDQVGTINTYNYETALTQTLQFTYWDLGGKTYLALQVHGGCDVRGGYTRPRVFSGDWEQFLDFTRLSVYCSECGFSVDYASGGYYVEQSECGDKCGEWCGNIENQIPTDEPPIYGREWKPADGCPCCKSPLGN